MNPLYRIVADLVHEHGPSTADDLMPRLEAMNVTREQVLQALRNAMRGGLVKTDDVRSINKPATYYPLTGAWPPVDRGVGLRESVLKMIRERGCGTMAHLYPTLSEHGYTKHQISKALDNARRDGLLTTEGRAKKGKRLSVYWPVTPDPRSRKSPTKKVEVEVEPAPVLIASVFDLGRHRTDWPQRPQGPTYATRWIGRETI